MRIKNIILSILLTIYCAPSYALDIHPRNAWDGKDSYFNFVETETEKIPPDVTFPIVFYLFGINKFYETLQSSQEIDKDLPEEITLPLYLGYIVVDSNYHYRFVDKSSGLSERIENLVDNLNCMGPTETVCDRLWGCFPRWSFKGFWTSKDQFFELGLIDMHYKTFGFPPNDKYTPKLNKTIHVKLGDSIDVESIYYPLLDSLSLYPPIDHELYINTIINKN